MGEALDLFEKATDAGAVDGEFARGARTGTAVMTSHSDARQLGLWMTSALVVGSIIGSGIFLLPMSLAPLGLNAVVGWVVSGAGALAIAYSLARICSDGAGIQTY